MKVERSACVLCRIAQQDLTNLAATADGVDHVARRHPQDFEHLRRVADVLAGKFEMWINVEPKLIGDSVMPICPGDAFTNMNPAFANVDVDVEVVAWQPFRNVVCHGAR